MTSANYYAAVREFHCGVPLFVALATWRSSTSCQARFHHVMPQDLEIIRQTSGGGRLPITIYFSTTLAVTESRYISQRTPVKVAVITPTKIMGNGARRDWMYDFSRLPVCCEWGYGCFCFLHVRQARLPAYCDIQDMCGNTIPIEKYLSPHKEDRTIQGSPEDTTLLKQIQRWVGRL